MGHGMAGTRVIQRDPTPVDAELEAYRRELTGTCYRMLGSAFEAEDAVQETLLRAWRGRDDFEGRASLRTWLYRIAINVCIDMARRPQRRARPMDFGPASVAPSRPGPVRPDADWVGPIPDDRVLVDGHDPAAAAVARESIRLAFVAALQHLPPRQRAVLILREVLQWPAAEVASLLDTSVPSVNSMLQRARATVARRAPADTDVARPMDADQQRLLAAYVEAFERYDMDSLVGLLHEDATQTMPPFDMWLRGRDEVVAWMLGPGAGCRGSRMVATLANGSPAFAQYRVAEDGDGHEAWALQVLEIREGRIVGLNAFLQTGDLFPLFGLPARLPA